MTKKDVRSKICVVEDSPALRELLSNRLSRLYDLRVAESLTKARELIFGEKFDLILLDVELPDGTGFQLCSQLRADSRTKYLPILFLTGKVDRDDKHMGFSIGADDYICKPFDTRELLDRIEARLRPRNSLSEGDGDHLEIGDLIFDRARLRVFLLEKGQRQDLNLTPLEFRILHFLAKTEGAFFTRTEILEQIHDSSIHVGEHVVYTHISALRKKLASRASYIKSSLGRGYCFSRS
jgi:DNA-binding response OmpR family regulator